jgi:hypothetical protein
MSRNSFKQYSTMKECLIGTENILRKNDDEQKEFLDSIL